MNALRLLSAVAYLLAASGVSEEQMKAWQQQARDAARKECDNQKQLLAKSPLNLSPDEMNGLLKTFDNSYMFTISHTLKVFPEDNSTYVTTGDIPWMWLRDSCKQLLPYLPLAAGASSPMRQVILSAMHRMTEFFSTDIYGSAFYLTHGLGGDAGPSKNECPPSPNCPTCSCTACAPACGDYTYQRDYELDSVLHMLLFHVQFYEATGYIEHLASDSFKTALENILKLCNTEMYHHSKSPYVFNRPIRSPFKDGIGLVWSFARPSDDPAAGGYSIADNIMLVAVMKRVAAVFKKEGINPNLQEQVSSLAETVEQAVEKYGVAEENQRRIYAYEVDGFGNKTVMDGANMPNLLWIPYLGYEDHLKLYNNTRSFSLSHANRDYFTGTFATGIGSQHTSIGLRPTNPGPACRDQCVWHLGLIMEGWTSDDRGVKLQKLKQILSSTSGQYLMHEGFDPNNPSVYNRDWFGWADSLFAMWVMKDWINPAQ